LGLKERDAIHKDFGVAFPWYEIISIVSHKCIALYDFPIKETR
jgi:hypothetical protein